jgi:hypothetical protein
LKPTLKAQIKSVIAGYENIRSRGRLTLDQQEQMALEIASVVLSWNEEQRKLGRL